MYFLFFYIKAWQHILLHQIIIFKKASYDPLKAIFSIFWVFLHPQIPDFQIFVSQPNIILS